MNGLVESAFPSSVEPVPHYFAGAGFEWCCSAGHGELGLGRVAVGVADFGEDRGGECADAVDVAQAGSALVN